MDTGGKIRTGKILEQLSKTHEITLISNVESSKDTPYVSQMNRFCTKFISVLWKEPKRYSLSFYVRLFFKMFSIYPVTALNDYSNSLRLAIEKELASQKYDVAICDFVQSALNFKNIKNIPVVLFQHNVESMIARRQYEHASSLIFKIFWWLQWKKMFFFEKHICHCFDLVIAVSEEDKKLFQELYDVNHVHTIPTGVDIDYYSPCVSEPVQNNILAFCGSMDWLPNEDAMFYLIDEILPQLKRKLPQIQLYIIGRNPSDRLKQKVKANPEVKLTGWVEDTRPFICKSTLFIVPIRVGGGTRLKIYEAMAMGKAVISTSIGAEGLPVTNGENIVIVDNPVEFQNRIIELLEDKEKREKIGAAASLFVRENFAWQRVSERFSELISYAVDK
jgi:glycosyltransferase involved in cell wall biosynthesis